jgi:hypothetical protein
MRFSPRLCRDLNGLRNDYDENIADVVLELEQPRAAIGGASVAYSGRRLVRSPPKASNAFGETRPSASF